MIALYTDRLVIRTIQQNDWSNVLAINSDQTVLTHIRPVTSTADIESTFKQRLEPWSYDSGDWLTLIIETIQDKTFVGLTGFYKESDAMNRAEVGYLISPNQQGLGYGTESLKAVIDWGIHEFNIQKFIGYCAVDNIGSAQVMRKCGFIQEGLLRQNHKIGDRQIDEYLFGLLQSDIRI
ncbi:GCN5 family acetyltransferase [Shewanella sp. UCD-FRSSP16_17]|uniref:GNAT family N-acetyltransferase n=1 Tax=Shewanella sp. UCD-FRSSP16_17 TaxID=1853256 RepID=UPI0007EEE633|nr:GNAT family protein [Shewanella sp. UCD-FRSSP16_17]OBT11912.1 GCN5 family acetyltransferase [Shewanella sp. UCD-FRSSP16_17]